MRGALGGICPGVFQVVYLLGRALGSTNVLLWDSRNRLIDSLDLEVVHDLGGLKSKLHELLPNEEISVYSAQGALVLRGQVTERQMPCASHSASPGCDQGRGAYCLRHR